MASKNKVRLADIAAKCNVEVPTVSRVLNNVTSGFSVKPELREMILRTARELQYSPNILAKNLQRQKTDLIMIYGYDFDWTVLQYLYPLMLASATQKLQTEGYQVNAVFPAANKSYSSPQMMDGALLITNMFPELAQELRYRGLPYVIMNDRGAENESWIDADDKQGTILALEYLYSLGHRKIAYWGNLHKRQHSTHKSVHERRETYKQFIKGCGETELCFDYMEDEIKIIEAARHGDLTAILCYDTLMAEKLIDTSIRNGISVPEQLSVCGFNRAQRMFQSNILSVTSVSMPAAEMGETAASIMIKSLSEAGHHEQHSFKMSLHEGPTTAPLRI